MLERRASYYVGGGFELQDQHGPNCIGADRAGVLPDRPAKKKKAGNRINGPGLLLSNAWSRGCRFAALPRCPTRAGAEPYPARYRRFAFLAVFFAAGFFFAFAFTFVAALAMG